MIHLENRLAQKITQKTVLTPQLVQMVNLLALNRMELADMIAEELVENPVLEEATEIVEEPESGPERPGETDASDTQFETPGEREERSESTVDAPEPESAADDPFRDFDLQEFEQYLNDGASRPRETESFERPSFETFLSRPSTLVDHLEWQLGLMSIQDPLRVACEAVIGNLNEDGYLAAVDARGRETPLSLDEVARSSGSTEQDVERALLIVQGFDPVGVAARDLRECLLIQLASLPDDHPEAMQIVTDHLRSVQNRRFQEIGRALGRPLDAVLSAVEVIKALDPRPGRKYNRPEASHIEPDVFLVKEGDEYKVVANEDGVPPLRFSRTYRKMLERGETDPEVRNYVQDRFKSAVQLLKNLEQRKNMIVRVCEVIIRHQADFLDNGIDGLRPMMMKDVAEEVGVHSSTVSRAVANKYAHTPQGVYELRFFFSGAAGRAGGAETSLTLVRAKVKRIIEAEDPRRPLTDDRVAALLSEQGISVTRRSITKYREDLKIPSTRQRRVR